VVPIVCNPGLASPYDTCATDPGRVAERGGRVSVIWRGPDPPRGCRQSPSRQAATFGAVRESDDAGSFDQLHHLAPAPGWVPGPGDGAVHCSGAPSAAAVPSRGVRPMPLAACSPVLDSSRLRPQVSCGEAGPRLRPLGGLWYRGSAKASSTAASTLSAPAGPPAQVPDVSRGTRAARSRRPPQPPRSIEQRRRLSQRVRLKAVQAAADGVRVDSSRESHHDQPVVGNTKRLELLRRARAQQRRHDALRLTPQQRLNAARALLDMAAPGPSVTDETPAHWLRLVARLRAAR
jgi:hypothetical protein